MFDLVKRIKFRTTNNEFQDNLANITKEIHEAPQVHVYSDKTGNLYKLHTSTYNQLLLK